jgi:hypothetical protein
MSASIGHCDWSTISAQGAQVECLWDFSSDSSPEIEVDEFIIEGSKGSLQMGGMGAGLPIKVLNADGTVVHVFEFDPPEHSAQPLIQLIADELNDSQDAECTATAANAARTSEVLDSILNGYYGGRHDEFWSREETWPGLE